MVSEADEILRAMAARWDVRVRASNLRWPSAPGETFRLTCRGEVGGLSLRLRSNGPRLLAEIEKPTALCFAGPVPDRIVNASVPFGRFAELDIFVPSFAMREDLSEPLRRWLASNALRLRSLLADDEQFVIARNASHFLLRPRTIDAETLRLDELVAIVSTLPPEHTGRSATASDSVVPLHLRDLAAMAALWATDDDERRTDLIDAASNETLSALVEKVTPHLAEIDTALSYDKADEMLHLHHLAQAALEAREELTRRTGRDQN
jgi:hypothetical protein